MAMATATDWREHVIGRGFLGMLVIYCGACHSIFHFKPLFGSLHVCTR